MKAKDFLPIFYSYIAMIVLFTAAIIAVHFIPKQSIDENIVSSAKTLQEEGFNKRFLNLTIFKADNFTDTYMLNIAASADENHAVDCALSNYTFTSGDPDTMAFDTERLAKHDSSDLSRDSYARYWHGYLVFLRPLLTITDYSGIRIINYILLSALLIICLWLMWTKIAAHCSMIFAISLLMINFATVPYSMQFTTCFFVAFAGIAAILAVPQLTCSRPAAMSTFFILGGITAFLDFLTTPLITLGLPLITLILSRKPARACRWIIGLSAMWISGYGMIWASKWILAYFITGHNIIADAFEAARLRAGNSVEGVNFSLSRIAGGICHSLAAKRLLIPVIIAAVATLSIMAWYMRKPEHRTAFANFAWLLLVAATVPVWFMLLRNHSIVHYWFTWRNMVIVFFSVMLFCYHTLGIKCLFKKK